MSTLLAVAVLIPLALIFIYFERRLSRNSKEFARWYHEGKRAKRRRR